MKPPIYEVSDETRQIIEDWSKALFTCGEMPETWFLRQPDAYRANFKLTTQQHNAHARDERIAAAMAADKELEKADKPKRRKAVNKSDDAEHIYVVKIEGNSNVTGYGYTTNLPLRTQEHHKNVENDGSEITEWKTFGFRDKEAKAVERLIIARFPLADCTISGFVKESTDLDKYDEVVEFVENMHALVMNPNQAEVPTPQ